MSRKSKQSRGQNQSTRSQRWKNNEVASGKAKQEIRRRAGIELNEHMDGLANDWHKAKRAMDYNTAEHIKQVEAIKAGREARLNAPMTKEISSLMDKADRVKVKGNGIPSVSYKAGIGSKNGTGKGAIFHRVAKTADNLGTGLRLNTGWAAAGLGALAVGTALSVGIGQATEKTRSIKSRAEEVGTLPGMSYDAIGSGNRDLGATGDLVFGLNRMRRGGGV